jgi:predicted ATPase
VKRNNCYIITGWGGVGKTTLLNGLRSLGFRTVDEDAREIIRHQMDVGGDVLPWGDKALYARLMLDASIRPVEERWTVNILKIVFK